MSHILKFVVKYPVLLPPWYANVEAFLNRQEMADTIVSIPESELRRCISRYSQSVRVETLIHIFHCWGICYQLPTNGDIILNPMMLAELFKSIIGSQKDGMLNHRNLLSELNARNIISNDYSILTLFHEDLLDEIYNEKGYSLLRSFVPAHLPTTPITSPPDCHPQKIVSFEEHGRGQNIFRHLFKHLFYTCQAYSRSHLLVAFYKNQCSQCLVVENRRSRSLELYSIGDTDEAMEMVYQKLVHPLPALNPIRKLRKYASIEQDELRSLFLDSISIFRVLGLNLKADSRIPWLAGKSRMGYHIIAIDTTNWQIIEETRIILGKEVVPIVGSELSNLYSNILDRILISTLWVCGLELIDNIGLADCSSVRREVEMKEQMHFSSVNFQSSSAYISRPLEGDYNERAFARVFRNEFKEMEENIFRGMRSSTTTIIGTLSQGNGQPR